jgi:16S rRNA (guanine527-N7)-methyltransferase
MSKAQKEPKLPDFLPGRPWGPEDFAAKTNVSRETLARLKAYAGLLTDWNSRHNLVSANSLEDLWRRHFWDSAQLAPLIPKTAKTLADLGSGAGFPGLVLAEMLRGQLAVTLYEATAKKCAFLAAVAEQMQLSVTIHNVRVEEAPPQIFDVITARACAPLAKLLAYTQRFSGPNSVSLLLKGQNMGSELTEAHKSWKMNIRQIPSLTHPSGAVLEVTNLKSGKLGRS